MYTVPYQPHTGLHETCVAIIAILIACFIIRFRFNYQLLLISILFNKGVKLIGIILLIIGLTLIFSHLTRQKHTEPKAITTINHNTNK